MSPALLSRTLLAVSVFAFSPLALAAPPREAVRCARETETCSFTGQRTVYYGADSTWVTQVGTNGIACGNQVFGDPLPGVVKACYVVTANPPAGTARCAAETETCSFSGQRLVFFGSNDTWVERVATNGVACGAGTFGDPLPGVVKACYVEQVSPPPGTTRCARETETCSFTGTRTVYYGAQTTWVRKTANNGVACGNGVFGDPLPGVVKSCYVGAQ